MKMALRILVAYATKHGSTREIAEAVARELQAAGHSADAAAMKDVKSLNGYDAVVLGVPLYMGRMVGDVGKFVGRHKDNLLKIPVFAFAAGVAPVSKEPGAVGQAMEALQKSLLPVQPIAATVFAGNLDPVKLNFITRRMLVAAKIPSGDFRDWDAIRAWTRDVAGKIEAGKPSPAQ